MELYDKFATMNFYWTVVEYIAGQFQFSIFTNCVKKAKKKTTDSTESTGQHLMKKKIKHKTQGHFKYEDSSII